MIKISAPNRIIKTTVSISGSKSLSNRLLMIRAISGLDLHFKNLSDSDDTITLAKELGTIQGKTHATLDIGHAGTDMRFLTAYLAGKIGSWVLTGSERMKQRPIGELVNALRKLGADIKYLEKEGFPPLQITGKKLAGGHIEIEAGISSQFITALLLVAPLFENGISITLNGKIVSKAYITMTIELLKQFGIDIEELNNTIQVKPSSYKLSQKEIHVESDWSSASYWYSIVALSKDAEIKLDSFERESLQPDSVLANMFESLGVKTDWTDTGVRLSKLNIEGKDFEYDFMNCPDLAQTVAATCAGLKINAKLNGLQTLKIKESDRIQALKNELSKFGAKVSGDDNSISIQVNEGVNTPSQPIQTYNDHRMAMSMAPLAMVTDGFDIEDPDVVNKSYAAFWDDLQEAGIDIE